MVMIDTLRKLIDSLEGHTEAQQQEAARRIEPIVEELSPTAWDEFLATPEAVAYPDELATEAEEERRADLLVDLDEALETGE
jgi:hypothetical protein